MSVGVVALFLSFRMVVDDGVMVLRFAVLITALRFMACLYGLCDGYCWFPSCFCDVSK